MSPAKAEFLLKDLARWVFGELLADRAKIQALPPEDLAAEVRAYRYGILLAALPDPALRERGLAEPLVGASWQLMQEWAALAEGRAWDSAAEIELSGHFLGRMQKAGELTEPLRRFARGKAFKYGRRVLMLSEKYAEL